jgi:hypothetical protein
MRGLSTLIVSAVLGGGLLFGAAPASALDIHDFLFSWTGTVPEVHVTFDLHVPRLLGIEVVRARAPDRFPGGERVHQQGLQLRRG